MVTRVDCSQGGSRDSLRDRADRSLAMMPDAWAGAALRLDESSCPHCRSEQCDGGCHDSTSETTAERTSVSRFRTAAELMAEPSAAPVIDDVAYEGSVTIVVAESGAGKT